jgi:polar amino acid transport system ATP-binding protein
MELKINNVTRYYDDKLILDHINAHIEDKEAIAIIGPSGAGKSTLLRLLSKIEEPDDGSICVNNNHLSEIDPEEYYKSIGFVFQAHTLFPHLTVLRNITLVLEQVHKHSKEKASEIAMTLLKHFELEDHMHKRASQLSGGQSQRVSIVRSLAISPEVLFLDEPTSALDPVLTQEVLNTILKLREENTDFVIVTHEIAFAKKAADYIIYMQDGKIVEMGDVKILEHPQTEELKSYLSNVFMW